MRLLDRLRTVWHATFAPIRGATHAERLEAYYRSQAGSYDGFREHLLHGRGELLEALPLEQGTRLVEMGAGTGWNVEALGETRRALCRSIVLVDLCESLQGVARQRVERHGWSNVTVVRGDVTTYEPAGGGAVDVVLFSYSLTMIPDWFRALDQAWKILRPGGVIAATDFYISRPYPESGLVRHSRWRRMLWPACFRWHNVFLSADHLPYLRHRFETQHLAERLGHVPFMMGIHAPYYVFVGRKRPEDDRRTSPAASLPATGTAVISSLVEDHGSGPSASQDHRARER